MFDPSSKEVKAGLSLEWFLSAVPGCDGTKHWFTDREVVFLVISMSSTARIAAMKRKLSD